MDRVLRTINSKLEPIENSSEHNYSAMYTTLLPNELAPEFCPSKLRKMKLHVENPVVLQYLQEDLRGSFRELFGGLLKGLDWGVDDLEERVGLGTAHTLAGLLGWESPVKMGQ
jgi:hypothetical protein